MPTLDLPRADGSIVRHTVPDVAQDTVVLQSATQLLTNKAIRIADDDLFGLGDGDDGVLLNRSTALAANTTLLGVVLGTAATLASAANSLLIANKTASGDVHIIVNKGGNSHTAFLADASTGDTILNAAVNQSVDIYAGGTKLLDYASGAFAFQAATVISTADGNLSFSASGTNIFTKNVRVNDNQRLILGTTGDVSVILNSAGLSADEEVTNVIVGTSNHQGVAANSLIISNVTGDGDILVLVSDGGNSLEMIKMTGATAELSLGWGALKIGLGADLAAITRPASVSANAAAIITELVNLGLFTA